MAAYSQEAQAQALYLVQRKAAGKRIALAYENPETQQAYAELLKNKSIRRSISEGNSAYLRARESGFSNTQEFSQVSATLNKANEKGDLEPAEQYSIKRTPAQILGSNNSRPETITLTRTPAQMLQAPRPSSLQELKAKEGFSVSVQEGIQPSKATMFDKPVNLNYPAYFQQTIIERQVGSFRSPDTGRSIPLKEIKFIDPFGKSLGMGAFESVERAATPEERDYFEKETRPPLKKEKESNKFKRKYGEIVGGISYTLDSNDRKGEATIDRFVSDESIEKLSKVLSKTVPVAYAFPDKKGTDFLEGAIKSIALDIKRNPFSTVALIGAGYVGGALFQGLPSILRTIPKIGMPTARVAKVGLNIFGAALTTVYVGKTVGDISTKENYLEKGEIFGKSAKDLTLFGYGFSKGVKGARVLEGSLSTLGRTEVVTQQGKYPQASPNTQLGLFKKNIIPELGKEPGGFHSTSVKFFDSLIQPKAGASELPGLYVSTKVSTPFLKIQGEQTARFNIESYLKDLVSVSKPAIAFLKPLAFREVKISYSSKPSFKGQKKIKGRGYAQFVEPAKQGVVDIPKIKSEIEGIARVEAGEYILESNKFFTEVNGVNIPLDVFKSAAKPKTSLKTKSDPLKDVVFESLSYEYNPYSSNKRPYSNLLSTSKRSSSQRSSVSRSSAFPTSSKASSSSSKSSSSISSPSTVDSYVKSISSNVSSSVASSSSSIKSGSYRSSRSTGYSYSPNTPLYPNLPSYFKRKKKPRQARATYSVFLLRGRGKRRAYRPVASDLGLSQALQFGEKKALSSLGRTFKVRQTGTAFTDSDIQAYLPDERRFRNYRIKNKKKIALAPFTYIQRRGIDTRTEANLLKMARAFPSSRRKRKR